MKTFCCPVNFALATVAENQSLILHGRPGKEQLYTEVYISIYMYGYI